MRAYLDNKLLSPNEANLSDIGINYTLDNTSSYAGGVAFYGWAYDLLKAELIDTPKGWLKTVPFRVEKTCCGGGIVFDGFVRGDQINWSSDGCEITAEISEDTEERGALRYIRSTLITDHLEAEGHPYLLATSGRNKAITAVQIYVNALLRGIFTYFLPLIAVFNALGGANSTLWDDYKAFLSRLDDTILTLLGQTPVMPYVRDIISQGLSPGGYTFQSSILNDSDSEYFNVTYLSIIEEAYNLGNENSTINNRNLPVRSIEGFLKELALVFNAEFFFIGNVLHFERRDLLPFLPTFNISNQENLNIDFSYKSDQKAAYFDLQYSNDSQESGGNELLNEFNHIEEWNASNDETQEGAFEVILPFSPYASGVPWKSQKISSIIDKFLSFFGIGFNLTSETIELSETFVYVPKLVPVNPSGDAFILDTGDQMKGENLYNNFYEIENPRTSGFRGVDFDATFTANCDFINSISGIRRVFIPYGNTTALAYVNTIVINYKSNEVSISGEL